MIRKLITLFKLGRKIAKSDILNITSKFKQPPLAIKIIFQILSFSFSKKQQNNFNQNEGERLSSSLESMGTTFIKLGQFLATRPDIIGERLSDQLQTLQDKVPAFSKDVALNEIKAGVGIDNFKDYINISEPIAAGIFHYGEFSDYDLKKASEAIAAYSIGIIGLISVKILAPGFYSRQDIKTPVKIAIITLIITQCLNYLFVPVLGHAGLALAISIAAIFNTFLLLFLLIKRKIYRPKSDWFLFKVKVFFSSSIIFYFFSYFAQNIDWVSLQNQPLIRISLLLFFLVIGFALYLIITKILGINLKALANEQ